MQLRASLGTLVHLGIKKIRMDVPLNTGYFLVGRGCRGRCHFCVQSFEAHGRKDKLSRIIWHWIDVDSLKDHREKLGTLERICFQCLDYPGLQRELTSLIGYFRNEIGYCGSLSASLNPFSLEELVELRRAGLDNVSIPLDVPTGTLYQMIKGKRTGEEMSTESLNEVQGLRHEINSFEQAIQLLEGSVSVFGEGKVTTHLIVGLGENDREMIERLHWLGKRKINVGLFAFTPLAGTPMHDRVPPTIGRYRAIQLSYYLLAVKELAMNIFNFGPEGQLVGYDEGNLPEGVRREINGKDFFGGVCFRTTGCPDCSRPYYNEKPGRTPYNYPRALSPKEIKDARAAIWNYFANGTDASK